MTSSPTCRRCGALLSVRVSTAGDCPRCLVARVFSSPAEELEKPADFGDYTIGDEIGRGGMGVVYRARQRSLDREVALKFLPFALLASEDFLERFEREARLMARLTHSGIARVFEAGISPRGRPFLAMELVAGEPLTAFLRNHSLPLVGRLELFLQICDAVKHAHQRGIIHRDLKPSNVLVTESDNRWVSKVIDFGLARPADDIAADAAQWRSQTSPVGTPLYMSPEQASGGEVDTRADVYALGVMLCEMLAGEAPFSDVDFSSVSHGKFAEILRDRNARSPSEVLAERRNVSNHPIRRAEILGDLDAICLRAMSKRPVDRYETVASMAEDIRRHLLHQPVSAMGQAPTYLLGKYARRHRILLGVAALVMSGFAAAAIYSRGQARVARLERDRAERVKAFLIEVLGAPSPGADGRNVKVIEVLARAKEQAESDLKTDAPALADVRLTLGTTYYNLSLYDEAEPLLRAALDDQRRLSGNHSMGTAEALKAMGELCNWTSREAEARTYLKESIAIGRENLPESAAALGRTLQSLASVEIHAGQCRIAIPLLEESIRLAVRAGGAGCSDALVAMGDHAMCLDKLGQSAAARPIYEVVIAGMTGNAALRENLTTMLSSYSDLLVEAGDLTGAERLLEENVKQRCALFGDEATPVAVGLGKLAWVRFRQGKYAQAEVDARAGLAIQRKLLVPADRGFYFTLRPLAFALLKAGRAAEAEPLCVELVEISHRHLSADAEVVLQAETGLAEARAALR